MHWGGKRPAVQVGSPLGLHCWISSPDSLAGPPRPDRVSDALSVIPGGQRRQFAARPWVAGPAPADGCSAS